MAILPVSNMIQQPNIVGNFQQGYAVGQQQRKLREQELDQQRLRELTPQVLAGDPNAYTQAATIDPQAAGQLQGAGDNQLRRLEGLINYMDEQEKSGNPQQAQMAWQTQGVPYVRQFAQGAEPTQNWAEAKPMLEQVRAKIAMAKAGQAGKGDEMKSLRIGANGNYWAIQGNEFVDTGVRADPRVHVRDQPGLPFDLINLRDGGSLYNQQQGGQPMGTGSPAQAPTRGDMEGDIALANDMLSAGIPEAQIDAFLQSRGQRANEAAGVGSPEQSAPATAPQLPPQLDYGSGGERPPARPAMTPAQAAAEQRAQAAAGRADRADSRAQDAFERSQRGNPPAGMRWNAAGTALERIPGAPPPKGSQTSEGERAAAGYLQRMAASELELQGLREDGYRPETAVRDYFTAGEGPALNWMASDKGQQNRQQQEDWVRAKLRKESGAVIADEEMDREIKTYFPQPGDREDVILAKARSRQLALQQMRQMAGRALRQADAAPPPTDDQFPGFRVIED